jgi:DNA-binding MarR family transcriptional regulator
MFNLVGLSSLDPMARERAILDIEHLTELIEEVSEVIQASVKIFRFGPGFDGGNPVRLSREVGDVLALIKQLENAGLVRKTRVQQSRAAFNALAAKPAARMAPSQRALLRACHLMALVQACSDVTVEVLGMLENDLTPERRSRFEGSLGLLLSQVDQTDAAGVTNQRTAKAKRKRRLEAAR